jgi:hypothetical protein
VASKLVEKRSLKSSADPDSTNELAFKDRSN